MSPSAGGGESAPASFDAILDSISAMPTTQAAPEAPAPAADPLPGRTEVEPAEEPEPVAAESAEPEAEPEVADPALQPEIEEGIRPWGKDYRVTKPRMDQFVAQKNFAKEIQRFAPTVADATDHYHKANDWAEMHSDFSDPAQIDNWMQYWQGQNPSNFAEMARRLPERIQASSPQVYGELQQKLVANLKTENPALYKDIANRAVQERVDGLYDTWANLDPVNQKAEAEQARFKAQQADFMLNGQYRNEVTRIDPIERQRRDQEAKFAAREKAIVDQQTALENQKEQGHAQFWSNWDKRISTDKATVISNEIATALKPAEGRFDKPAMEAFADHLQNIVQRKMNEDFEWNRNRQLDFNGMKRTTIEARKTGKHTDLGPTVKAYLDSHIAFARPIIQETARALIGQATARQVQDSQQAHQRLASGQKPAANGNRPATSPIGTKTKAVTGADGFDAFFESIGAQSGRG